MIDKFFNADNTAIESLKEKVSSFSASIARMPSLKDYMIILGVVFGAVGLSHWASVVIPEALIVAFPSVGDKSSMLSTFSDGFFWMITVATAIGIIFSLLLSKIMKVWVPVN